MKYVKVMKKKELVINRVCAICFGRGFLETKTIDEVTQEDGSVFINNQTHIKHCICGRDYAEGEYNFLVHQLQGLFFDAKWSGLEYSHEETLIRAIEKLDTILETLMDKDEYEKYMSQWMTKNR